MLYSMQFNIPTAQSLRFFLLSLSPWISQGHPEREVSASRDHECLQRHRIDEHLPYLELGKAVRQSHIGAADRPN